MIIALPIEIKSREYLPKLYLAYNILKYSKHKVIIGKKSEIYSIFKKSKNIFLISKSGPKKKFTFKKGALKNNFFSILDEEGPLANLRFKDFKNRCSNKVLSYCDYYFTWGKEDKMLIKKKTTIKCKVLNFGHPKFDLLINKNNSLVSKEKYLQKKFNNFVFFPSNFHQDQIMDNKDYLIWRSKQAINDKNFIKRSSNLLKKDLNNYISSINLIKKLAVENPKTNFIFRPHPRQDYKKVKKRFGKNSKNIFIEHKFSISPYISACNVYMHRGCTSVLEAAKLKKKIIYLKNYNYNQRDWMSALGYNLVESKKEIKIISNIIKGKLKVRQFQNSTILKNIGKKQFCENFVSFINSNRFKKVDSVINCNYSKTSNAVTDGIKSNIKNFFIKSNIVRKTLSHINEDLILPRSYGFSKFDKLTSDEIQKDIKKLFVYREKKRTKKIELQKININSFLLKKVK